MVNLTYYIGEAATLEQTAEEATELAFACLKLARMIRDENKVHGYNREELDMHLAEEAADVTVCIRQLYLGKILDQDVVEEIISRKTNRMTERVSGVQSIEEG